MKKKFTLHLDAILVLSLLFVMLIGFCFFQQSQVNILIQENERLQWQSVEDSFNLSSQEGYIKKLQKQLEEDKPLNK